MAIHSAEKRATFCGRGGERDKSADADTLDQRIGFIRATLSTTSNAAAIAALNVTLAHYEGFAARFGGAMRYTRAVLRDREERSCKL